MQKQIWTRSIIHTLAYTIFHGAIGKWSSVRKNKGYRLAIIKRDNGQCIYCGSVHNLSLDHITAKSAYMERSIIEGSNGQHCEENLVTCCALCNSQKGATSYKAFIRSQQLLGRMTEAQSLYALQYIKTIAYTPSTLAQ